MLCFTFEYYIDFEDILNELYSRLSCGNIAIIMIAHDGVSQQRIKVPS